MKLLLDTHILLWYLENNSAIKKSIYTMIAEAEEVYISSASIWEIAIKFKLGKLDVNFEDLIEAIPESGFQELSISIKHTSLIAELSDYHNDPFDRILIAQAICEPLHLLTNDKKLAQHSELIKLI